MQRKVLEKYLAEGKTQYEIAELEYVSDTTVRTWMRKYGLSPTSKRMAAQKKKIDKENAAEKRRAAKVVLNGHNSDRHLCRSCIYRSSSASNGCDYAFLTEHSRGCDVEVCDKYIKGRRNKSNKRAKRNQYGKY